MRRGSGRRLVIALTVEAATGRGACWRSVIVLTVAAAKHGHGKDHTESKHQDRVVLWLGGGSDPSQVTTLELAAHHCSAQ